MTTRRATQTAEGESLPGPILEIGNPNSRRRFALPAAAFVNAWREQGPTHHCAPGVGQQAGALAKAASLPDLPFAGVP